MPNGKNFLRKESLDLYLFLKLVAVQMLSSLTTSLCSLVNTYIISNELGQGGLAQLQVINAVTNVVLIFTLLVTSGEVLLIGREICKGNHDAVNRLFSTTILISVVFSAVVGAACFLFTAPICSFFGADAEMLPACCSALRGFALFYLMQPLCAILIALCQIRSNLAVPIAVSAVIFVANVTLNYVFLHVMHLGIFYSALANSIAQTAAFIFLVVVLAVKKYVRFSLHNLCRKDFGALFGSGLTESSARVWSIIKATVMIKIAASVGGTGVLSSLSVISSIDAVTYGLFANAAGMVILMMAGIYINEGDRASLRRFVKTILITGVSIAAVLCTIMFISAAPAAVIYNVENAATHVKSQHIYSFAFIFYTAYMMLSTLYAALDKKKTVNILAFLTSLVAPLAAIITLSRLFGIIGFWHGILLGDMLAFAITYLYNVFKNKKLPRSVDDLLCLDDNFGVPPEDTLLLRMTNSDDATNASAKIIAFCKARGIDDRTAYFCGLCLEEIAVNTVTHGFRHTKKNGAVELAVINKPNTVDLIVRDNCKPFDPCKKLASYDKNDVTRGIGIRIVTQTAKTSYKNMYGLNILTMSLEKAK